MKIDSKLPDVGTTIFTVMSQLAAEHKSVNLGQGFPDFSPDKKLIELTNKAMSDGHNQYPPMAGIEDLRLAISEKISRLYGCHYNPNSEVTVTSGATEALMVSIQALVRPGDEVVVIEPMYDLYLPAITLSGGKAVIVSMQVPDSPESSYTIDWNQVADAITVKTRLLILNTPHNPTGMLLTEKDLDAIETLMRRHGFYVLSDEVYEHIVFDGKSHLSLSSRPSIANRSIVVSSFGKTYHITGWKIGYCVAPDYLMKEIRKIHQFTVFTVNTPMQYALASYMVQPETYETLSGFYQEKRDYLRTGLAKTALQAYRSDSTFFMLADYKNVSFDDENSFAQWLTVEKGVTVIPMSAFYQNPKAKASNNQLVRLCFAKSRKTIDLALGRLEKLR